jgi:hypothetical protein
MKPKMYPAIDSTVERRKFSSQHARSDVGMQSLPVDGVEIIAVIMH